MLETTDLLKHLDIAIEGELDAEKFDAAFKAKYVPLLTYEEKKNKLKEGYQVVDTTLKDFGSNFLGEEEMKKVKFKNDDGTPIKTSELAHTLLKRALEVHNEKLKAAINPDADAKLKQTLTDLEKERKLREEKDAELMEVRKSKEAEQMTYAEKLAQVELNHHVDDLYKNLPYSDQADRYWRDGFRADMDKKYKRELRDGKLHIFDLNGEPIKNKAKTANLTPQEVLDMELETAGKKKLNNVKRDERYKTPREDDKPRKGIRDTSATLAAMREA